MKKKIVILVALTIVALVVLEGLIKKYDGTVYSSNSYYPSVVLKSYEELKSLVYFGNIKDYAKNNDEKNKIRKFVNEMENRNRDTYNWEYANIQKYKDISNTLYDFIHNLYINTNMPTVSENEYEYVRNLLGNNRDESMFELLNKYNENFFQDKSLAVASYRFSSGGNLEYQGANKIGNILIIKSQWDTGAVETCAFTDWVIVVETDKNINKVYSIKGEKNEK